MREEGNSDDRRVRAPSLTLLNCVRPLLDIQQNPTRIFERQGGSKPLFFVVYCINISHRPFLDSIIFEHNQEHIDTFHGPFI